MDVTIDGQAMVNTSSPDLTFLADLPGRFVRATSDIDVKDLMVVFSSEDDSYRIGMNMPLLRGADLEISGQRSSSWHGVLSSAQPG